MCLFADQVVQMVIMSGTATVLQQFVSGLKNRNEDTRAKSAKDLQHYVTTELREVNKVNMDVIETRM
ncbi:Serine/threonine-protein kinase mTOR [Liparis tanakae]|uniref:Serine/threonine-protein kinase mTOR n=1 Tax=Liparis tanakae TaxID=230148 RepID=A0A4Z2FM73_9TELE|nr:Serine/threonine-protein kinase mTOR [Liparis tanakae]